jgi:hypothetical protein
MPVTARLSKLFYDRLGEAVANELVDWFNAVDATYRADLRELNELNFARFDAKLEQRMAESQARIDARFSELETRIGRAAAELDTKIDRVAVELNAKIDGAWPALNARIDRVAAELTATLERRLGEQTRWLFVAWATLLIPIIGLWMRG